LMILLALAVPSSISQGVIGAILGWGLCMGTADFSAAAKFFVSWVVTPVAGGLVCFLLCKFVRRFLENKILGLGHYDLILRIGFFAAGIFGAWSMGANAVANVTGVYGGPLGLLDEKTAALLGGALIALGALTFSRRTMHTVGSRITQLSPLSGLLAVCSYALIVFLYSLVGIPVSGSQAVVGAVIGAGLSKGVGTVDLGVLKNILSAWAITPAAAGGLAFAFGHIYLHFM